jgi:hypothetical protein
VPSKARQGKAVTETERQKVMRKSDVRKKRKREEKRDMKNRSGPYFLLTLCMQPPPHYLRPDVYT